MQEFSIDESQEEACQAYLDATNAIDLADFEEAYQGEWRNDEAFVQNLLEETDTIPSDLPGYVYIDWERTARNVMMDYSEENGHYFRNL